MSGTPTTAGTNSVGVTATDKVIRGHFFSLSGRRLLHRRRSTLSDHPPGMPARVGESTRRDFPGQPPRTSRSRLA
nr:hypothetical protein [Saccharothrix sp. ST-888]